jgi:hypothetical protein
MTDYRALCAELAFCWSRTTNPEDFAENAAPIIERMKLALAQPEPVGPTDEGYIDCDITGSDRALLNQFYAAAQREGGSADEVTLRGIHAVLNRPQVLEPTIEELAAMWLEQYGNVSGSPTMNFSEFVDAARAVLARWGRPAITPIPVSERLPGPEDCDAEGRCWYWDPEEDNEHWDFMPKVSGNTTTWTHWLPAHALPLPEGGAA